MLACRALALALVVLVCAGCRSNTAKFFRSSLAEDHPKIAEYSKYNVAIATGGPRIIETSLTNGEAFSFMEDGYVLLGYSAFWGPYESDGKIKAFAKNIGAELIVAERTFRSTVSGSMPLTLYSPQTTYTQGNLHSGGKSATFSAESTTYAARTTYIPYTTEQHNHNVLFFARPLRPLIAGIFVDTPSVDERKAAGVNGGRIVRACMRDLPGWRAGVLPGDLILSIEGMATDTDDQYTRALGTNAGKTVACRVWRNGAASQVMLELNPDPLRLNP